MQQYATTAIHVVTFPVSSDRPARVFLPRGEVSGIALVCEACTGSPSNATARADLFPHAGPARLSLTPGEHALLQLPTRELSCIERVVVPRFIDGVLTITVECEGGQNPAWHGTATVQYIHGVN